MAGIGIDTTIASQTASTKKNNQSNSSLDKDAFLKLLVTQMQYQDPLEPTSNTEYMSQLAQFSSVEELQNLSNTLSNSQSMNLTGQYVILNVPDSAGNITQVSGLVDYVTLSEGKTYLHINDEYYPSDYLDSVVSLDYLEHLMNQAAQDETVADGTENTESEAENTGEEDNSTDGTENA